MKILKEFIKLVVLFIIGGLIYIGMEVIFRGYSHWTMGILGGLCFIIIGGMNNYSSEDISVFEQSISGAMVITAFELVAGIILNIFLGLHIWDYSDLPFNILGQICLLFSFIWIFISIFAIFLDDLLRFLLFKEPFPMYKWI